LITSFKAPFVASSTLSKTSVRVTTIQPENEPRTYDVCPLAFHPAGNLAAINFYSRLPLTPVP
jgi:hypothetical protein